MKFKSLFYIFVSLLLAISDVKSLRTSRYNSRRMEDSSEAEAKEIIEKALPQLIQMAHESQEADWSYQTNVNKETEKFKTELQIKTSKFSQELGKKLLKFDFSKFKDEDLKRKMKFMTSLGDSLLSDEKYKELVGHLDAMQSNYAAVKFPSYKDNKTIVSLEPELMEIFQLSRDPEELKYYWVEYYNRAGTATKDDFFKYIALRNEAAKLNNITSGAEMWLADYEDETFEKQVEDILEQLMPFYKQLHGYVRHKLHEKYGDIVDLNKPIPMHLLGNIWGQTWDTISDILVPFPKKPIMNVTGEMIAQNYTIRKLYEMGDDFFTSLNMTKIPESFWEKSVLEKPADGRDMICHASSWYFFIPKDDVRIKQCTVVRMDHLFIAQHELGHSQYNLQYQDLPIMYQGGANPGFHEAVGDTLSLSASTPKHLLKVGLLKTFDSNDEEAQVNQQFVMALAKFTLPSFAYVMDKFRYEVFRGNIKPEEANCKFWEMREKYSGLEPPVLRTNEDFDPPAKYHISADVEYMRYFVSNIIQFQFYKAMCEKAGEYKADDPEKILSNCDFYKSSEAGNLFKAMLQMGSSKPWPDAMEVMTGQRKIDASAMLEYFKPLKTWLEKTNKDLNITVGWEKSDKYSCSSKTTVTRRSIISDNIEKLLELLGEFLMTLAGQIR